MPKYQKLWQESSTRGNDYFDRVEDARRLCAHHFMRAMALHEAGVLRGKNLKLAVSPSHVRLLIEVVQPLSEVHQGCDCRVFKFFRDKYTADDFAGTKDPFSRAHLI